ILDSGSTISESAQFRLQKLAQKYQYKLIAIDDKLLNALLKRVDEIPVSLVLIQAANETGWGTSRFAREGLNFFGEWCFTSGCGLVPNSRTSGKTHEVEVFDSVADSVASYMLNLNSNSAYSLLRSIRFQLRQQGMQPTAEELVYGLVNYSERKDAYIDELLEMLRHNKKYLVN
ncbi:MAG: glucosaminidase domain-containing protein, partial [Parashewanella sp.]